jgi:hypothetical protein
VNLGENCRSFFGGATHAGVKLAFKINSIANFVQGVIDNPQFVLREFHEHVIIFAHWSMPAKGRLQSLPSRLHDPGKEGVG